MRNTIIALLVLLAAGCTNTIGNEKLGSSESKIEKQMKDVKTKSDLRKTYGAPFMTFKKDGAEVHEYMRIDGSGRHAWLIPVYGWVVSFWQDDFSYDATCLYVRFDAKDNVKGYNVVQASGTSN